MVDLIGKTVVSRKPDSNGVILGRITGLFGSLAEVVNEAGQRTYVNVLDEKSVAVLAD